MGCSRKYNQTHNPGSTSAGVSHVCLMAARTPSSHFLTGAAALSVLTNGCMVINVAALCLSRLLRACIVGCAANDGFKASGHTSGGVSRVCPGSSYTFLSFLTAAAALSAFPFSLAAFATPLGFPGSSTEPLLPPVQEGTLLGAPGRNVGRTGGCKCV